MKAIHFAMRFFDRHDAAKQLAKALDTYCGNKAVVYALPRGGVIVGATIARALDVPLDLIIARKIGHPDNPEYAIGATTEHGPVIWNEEERLALNSEWCTIALAQAREQAAYRREKYTANRVRQKATGMIAIVVDDGIATGLTMQAAISALRAENPLKLIIAAPVAPREVVEELRPLADAIVVLEDEPPFRGGVGAYYDHFDQVSDEEVIAALTSLD